METIECLERLIQWDVDDFDYKFMLNQVDGVLYQVTLKGNPTSILDGQLDFDSIQLQNNNVGNYVVGQMYAVKNNTIIKKG